ncbi:MAG: SIS domain-containing protein [Fimbriimonadaceae bacterium]|nr:SIS domain-containing protein [Fimbriimonadaceae bacterium]
MQKLVKEAVLEAHRVIDELLNDETLIGQIAELGQCFASCLSAGNKILVAGNGGSMADALHFAEEWTGRFRDDRRAYPVMALGEATHFTCVGNDYGFDHVFARMVEAFAKSGDILLLLSTTGKSQNLVLAALKAKERDVNVVGLLGRGGGPLLSLCDFAMVAPGKTSDRIQEVQMLILHILIEVAEARLQS